MHCNLLPRTIWSEIILSPNPFRWCPWAVNKAEFSGNGSVYYKGVLENFGTSDRNGTAVSCCTWNRPSIYMRGIWAPHFDGIGFATTGTLWNASKTHVLGSLLRLFCDYGLFMAVQCWFRLGHLRVAKYANCGIKHNGPVSFHGFCVIILCLNSNPLMMLFFRRNRVSGLILNSSESSLSLINVNNFEIDMSTAMGYSFPSIMAIPPSKLFGSLMILPFTQTPFWSCRDSEYLFFEVLAKFSSLRFNFKILLTRSFLCDKM